jgi:hypothetical protein
MKRPRLSVLWGGLSVISCFSACVSSTRWNADQVAEIRRRAAFDMSCAPEDLEIVALARDGHGLVKKLRADGCGQRLLFVNARGDASAAQWTLGTNQFQAANQPPRHAAE